MNTIGTELGALVRRRAPTAEKQAHLTDDVVAALHRSGLYRQWIPRVYNGMGSAAGEGIEAIRGLSTHDGAAGWCLMIANTTSLLAHSLPIEAAEAIFGPPEALTGGFAAPRGRAVVCDGGYRVTGTWQWGSGSTHCTHIGGGCLVVDDHGNASGAAPFIFFERTDVTILDTWDVAGLCATGSNDYQVQELFVPSNRAAAMTSADPVVDTPLGRISFFGLLAAGVASVAVGIAQRALEELIALAADKVPQGSRRTLADRAATQIEVAKAAATIGSAWGLLTDAVNTCWDQVEREGANSPQRRVDLRLAATDAAQRSADAVRNLYLLGGGEAVYRRSPLQKQFRDIHVATQHAMVAERTYEFAGRVSLGLETDTRFI